MNIQSFSRMKSYRKNGRIAVILKLRLPHTDGSSGSHLAFDGFYGQVAEKYLSLAENAPVNPERGSRPTTVSVDYTAEADEYIKKRLKQYKKRKNVIAVKRTVRVNIAGDIRTWVYYDFYDADARVFIK